MKQIFITLLYVLIFTSKLYAGKSVDMGFYATAIRSNCIAELELIDKTDISEYQIFKNGKKGLIRTKYNLYCKVLNSNNSNQEFINLTFSVKEGVVYDDNGNIKIQKYFYDNHSGNEFYLQKGSVFIGLLDKRKDKEEAELLRAEIISYQKGLEMYNAAYLIQNYLSKSANERFDNEQSDYYYQVFYSVIEKNETNLNAILYYNPEKKVFAKINKDTFYESETLEYNIKSNDISNKNKEFWVKSNDDLFQLNSENLKTINRKKIDSLIVKQQYYSISKNLLTDRYTLKDSANTVRYDKLKDYTLNYNVVQIITNENELKYIVIYYNEYGFKDIYFKPTEDKHLIEFTHKCGTVPNYSLSLKETKKSFDLYSDETFFDYENKEPATKYLSISKKQADDVYFINMAKTMDYSSNDETNYSKTPIIKKNNQYSIGLSNNFYDSIQRAGNDFIVKKDNLYNYYNINKIPKYSKLENFVGNYARFELPNGLKGYLKIDGKEIYDFNE